MKWQRWARGLVLSMMALGMACTAPTVTIKIIALNDFHGNLESPGPFNGRSSGGIDVLASYVAELKRRNPHHLVVSAGDLIGATPLLSALFHDEPTIETMNWLGLEFNALGNSYGATRLEAAAQRALALGATTYRSVESILKHGLDQQPLPTGETATAETPAHANLRSADYYHSPAALRSHRC